jgi:hypothetical protein
MIYYRCHSNRDHLQEALMKNIFENLIANMLVILISTCVVLVLHSFGFSTDIAVILGLAVLLLLYILIYVVGRQAYPKFISWLTIKLLKDALKSNSGTINSVELQDQIVQLVTYHTHRRMLNESYLVQVYPNQETCEQEIVERYRRAKKVKILTIRGEKYFLGSKSLLRDITKEKLKTEEELDIKVLVLVPESPHITDRLARSLGPQQPEDIRKKMGMSLDNLKHLADQNTNFQVRCYDKTPIIKMLMFDDVMFVSAYLKAKNDRNTHMLRISRNDIVLFACLEKEFDDLWVRSVVPARVIDGRV